MPAHLDDDHNESKDARQTGPKAAQKHQENLAKITILIEAGVITRKDLEGNKEADRNAKIAAHHNMPPPDVIEFAKDRKK